MTSYALRRAGWMIVDLWIVLTITFVLSYLLPGDPARTIAGPHATIATVDRIRRQLGLDRPLSVQ
jgi:peptide/nickel transport system permease protein